jgi:hypothetical protein
MEFDWQERTCAERLTTAEALLTTILRRWSSVLDLNGTQWEGRELPKGPGFERRDCHELRLFEVATGLLPDSGLMFEGSGHRRSHPLVGPRLLELQFARPLLG